MPESKNKKYPGYLPDADRQAFPDGSDGGEPYEASVPVYAGSWKALFFIVLVVIAGLAVLADYAAHWKNEVVVRKFIVEGGSIVDGRELSSRLNIYRGRNLQQLDAEELKDRVIVFPYVRDVLISKELNGVVRVRIVEREPVALTIIDSRIIAIDREGFLFPGRKEFSRRIPKLLKVSGISRLKAAGNGLQQLDMRDADLLRHFLEALSLTDYASLIIRELHLEPDNMTYCIAARSPTRFIVGNDGNFKEKLKKFEIFWQKVVSKKGIGTYEIVDLRFRSRVFTREPASAVVPKDVSL